MIVHRSGFYSSPPLPCNHKLSTMNEDKSILHELREQGDKILDTVTKIQSDVRQIKDISQQKDDTVLEFSDVCDILRLGERQVHRLRKNGKLTGFKLGRRRLYRNSEVRNFLRRLEEEARRKETE